MDLVLLEENKYVFRVSLSANKIEIKNAQKFCQNVIDNTRRKWCESRIKVRELSGYFFWNAKKNKVLYYEVDMGTQTWYFGL